MSMTILCLCMLTSVFLCQTPRTPPSQPAQETGSWAWRTLSWTAAAEDTPNLRTSPGKGTVTTTGPVCCSYACCQQESDNYMLIPHHHHLHCNAICTAKLLFTWHWNVSQNIHKPPPTRIRTDYTPVRQQRSVLVLARFIAG